MAQNAPPIFIDFQGFSSKIETVVVPNSGVFALCCLLGSLHCKIRTEEWPQIRAFLGSRERLQFQAQAFRPTTVSSTAFRGLSGPLLGLSSSLLAALGALLAAPGALWGPSGRLFGLSWPLLGPRCILRRRDSRCVVSSRHRAGVLGLGSPMHGELARPASPHEVGEGALSAGCPSAG